MRAIGTNEGEAVAKLQCWLQDSLGTVGTEQNLLPQFDLDSLQQPVTELASQLGISVRQFERRCLSCFGMPLREYRRLARYSAAMTNLMLQGAQATVLADLAQEAGYVDQAHFTRDFSAMVGASPKRFQARRHLADVELWQFTREELESYLA